MLKEVHRVDYV